MPDLERDLPRRLADLADQAPHDPDLAAVVRGRVRGALAAPGRRAARHRGQRPVPRRVESARAPVVGDIRVH